MNMNQQHGVAAKLANYILGSVSKRRPRRSKQEIYLLIQYL